MKPLLEKTEGNKTSKKSLQCSSFDTPSGDVKKAVEHLSLALRIEIPTGYIYIYEL